MTTDTQVEPADTGVKQSVDPRQRTTLRLFAAIYFLVVFTGAIRKWMFPSRQIFYLLQDVPIVLAYIYALVSGFFTRGVLAFGVLTAFVVLLLLSMIQFIAINLPMKVALAGYHAYLFYLPMLLILPLAMDKHGRKAYIRWNILLNIPMSLLILMQSRSSMDSFINRTTGGKGFGGLGADIARGTGTFNFVSFYALWLAICFALCVGEWMLPRHERSISSTLLLSLSTFGCILSSVAAAERTSVAFAIIAMAGLALVSILRSNARGLLFIFLLCLTIPAIVRFAYILSPKEYRAFEDRLTSSGNQHEAKGMIASEALDFIPKDFDIVGKGIGFGTDAAHVGETGAYNFTYQLNEIDISRNLLELGSIAGTIYVGLRLSFVAALFLALRKKV